MLALSAVSLFIVSDAKRRRAEVELDAKSDSTQVTESLSDTEPDGTAESALSRYTTGTRNN